MAASRVYLHALRPVPFTTITPLAPVATYCVVNNDLERPRPRPMHD